MKSLEEDLMEIGFTEVLMPIGIGGQEREYKENATRVEDGQRKIDLDLINAHWQKILKCDCVLIANYEKNGIPGYVGGNTFLEMGFAFVTGKPIFMLNPIPNISYTSEIEGMQPIVIENNLYKIREYYMLS